LRAHRHVDDITDLVLIDAEKYKLTSDEERDVILKDAKAGNLLALRSLLAVYSGLVESVIQRSWFRCFRAASGFDLDDLRQVARLGVIRAMERFDPSRRVRFSTYARYWIRHHVNRLIANQLSQIRVPVWARADTWSQRRHKLRTSIREAVELASLPMIDIDDVSIPQSAEDDHQTRLRLVYRAIKRLSISKKLTPRDVEIVMRRYTSPGETLEEIGQSLNISRERVRQIEEGILASVRFAVAHDDDTKLRDNQRDKILRRRKLVSTRLYHGKAT
jgi:RNA polymerase sigma factor (sigma-70 family)